MEDRDIKWFPLDRMADLEAAISELVHDRKRARDGIGIALGLHGMRVGEITGALAKHFQPLNRSLYVCPYNEKLKRCQQLKNGVSRTIQLHQSLVDAIVGWRGTIATKQSKYLLPNRYGGAVKEQSLSKAGRDLLLSLGMMDDPSTRFHMLRHTSAMRILADTNDITLVSKHLGHKNIQTTMVYAHSLKQVPTSCLVKLVETPSQILRRDPQLTLFNPYDLDDSETKTA